MTHIYYISINLVYSEQILNFLFLDRCSSFTFHHHYFSDEKEKIASGRFFFSLTTETSLNVRHWNYSIYEFCRDVCLNDVLQGWAIKRTAALQSHISFFLCFPSLNPLVKSFHIWSYNEASFGLCLSGLNPLSFDPSINNDPLQFNGSSGPLVTECPPLENTTENSKKRKRASLPPGTVRLTAGTL